MLLIAGNHEFYYDPRDDRHVHGSEDKAYDLPLARIRNVTTAFDNVKFLEQESFNFPGTSIIILGCVLWSNVPAESETTVERLMNDYACIYDRKRDANDNKENLSTVTVGDLRLKHVQAVAWLLRSIDAYKAEQMSVPNPKSRLIVMTHHLPSFKLIDPHYRTSPVNPGCATDLEGTCLQPPVSLWTCGHSHYFKRIRINGVQCIINASGLADEDTGVQRGMIYTLE